MGADGGPSTDGSDDPREPRSLTCAACGTEIDPADWHPVRSWTDADGEFHIDAFCSMACRVDYAPE